MLLIPIIFFYQVIWGGRFQEGSACSTGEEVEQINSYMSRCGNTTKYMLHHNKHVTHTDNNFEKLLWHTFAPERYELQY